VPPAKCVEAGRRYVGLWAIKDAEAGKSICPHAVHFVKGERTASDPLPSVDGKSSRDFSGQIEKFTAKGIKLVESIEARIPSAALTADEQAMLSALKKWAVSLGKKRADGAFAALARTVESVERAKHEHQSAIPAIAYGMEALQQIESDHRKKRRDRIRKVLQGFEYQKARFFLGWAIMMASAALMIGLYGITVGFYVAGFFAIGALLPLTKLVLGLFTA
jgi:hypothetical protein